ncbi:MAG TPA: hypothetical protein VHX65_13885 [Pirellulales bacterium]|jgi:hypothetical protein|nr:hypothetical protein [Pirellulales bacterium]
MQAAVVSVLLMAGVCGAAPSPSNCENSPAVVRQGYSDGMQPAARLWSPVAPDGTVTYNTALFGRPRYSPLWLVPSRATFYPGNYARPYDYRERFDYPWNGPRPAPEAPAFAGPPAPEPYPPRGPLPEGPGLAASAQHLPASAWPTATAAEYVRQSQSRLASNSRLKEGTGTARPSETCDKIDGSLGGSPPFQQAAKAPRNNDIESP